MKFNYSIIEGVYVSDQCRVVDFISNIYVRVYWSESLKKLNHIMTLEWFVDQCKVADLIPKQLSDNA